MTRTVIAAALSLALLAACERTTDQPAAAGASATPPATSSTTPTTPANAGPPNAQEKREGANPVQGQVDPKQPEQQKDFQQRGDAAGPKN